VLRDSLVSGLAKKVVGNVQWFVEDLMRNHVPEPLQEHPEKGPLEARVAIRSGRDVPALLAFGSWALLAIGLVAAMALYTDLLRLANPIGEKYVPSFPPGQNDFSYPYFGARALLAGVNPYRNSRPEFTNLIFGVVQINGVDYKQLYPPGHFLTLVPLALWKGANWEAAARIWFRFNLLGLVALAGLTWAVVRRATETVVTPLWILVFYVCLALNPGMELCLERGQSDAFMGLLCWTAVLCFLRGSTGVAMFLAIWSTSIKMYPALFTAGLGLLALRNGRWKQTLIGVAAAFAIFVAPVARYFKDAANVMRYRAEMFGPVWYNHSFRNLVYRFAPAYAEKGGLVLATLALGIAAMAWIQTWRACVRGTPASVALWLAVFTTASLGTVLGYSPHSVNYNLSLILPGTLILASSQRQLSTILALPSWAGHALGLAVVGCLFLLFICRLGNDPPGYDGNIPAAAYGLGILFLILAGLLSRALARPIET
jgi:Glycosyltransferase family 87